MGFFGLCYADSMRLPLCGDDLLEDYRTLHVFLTPIESDSENGATHSGSDDSGPEGEGDTGPWRIGTSTRQAMELTH